MTTDSAYDINFTSYGETRSNNLPSLSPNASLSAFSTTFFPDIYRTVVGSLIFFGTLPFAFFHFRCFPMRTTSAMLFGAGVMVLTGVISSDQAYMAMGRVDRLTTIFLVIGVTLIAEFIDRQLLLRRAVRVLLKPDQSFLGYLFRVNAMSYLLGMIVGADSSSVLLVPVVVQCFCEQERDSAELETLLLGASSSATLGAASTLFGGPSIALIAAATHLAPHTRQLNLLACVRYFLPASLVCFCVNFSLLLLHQRRLLLLTFLTHCLHRRRSSSSGASRPLHSSGTTRTDREQELSGLTRAVANLVAAQHGEYDTGRGNNGFIRQEDSEVVRIEDRLVQVPTLETILEDEVLELPECPPSMFWSGFDQTSPTPRNNSNTPRNDCNQLGGQFDTPDHEEGVDQFIPSPAGSLRRTRSATEDLRNMATTGEDYLPSPGSSPIFMRPLSNGGDGVSSPRSSVQSSTAVSRSADTLSTVNVLSSRQLARFGYNVPGDHETDSSVIIRLGIGTVIVVMIALLLAAEHKKAPFDIGLVPFGCALTLVALDTAVFRRQPHDVLHRMDWTVILLILALFVWSDAFIITRLPSYVWTRLGFVDCQFTEVTSVAIVCIVLVATSNVFGQLPIALMVLSQFSPFPSSPLSPSILATPPSFRFVLFMSWTLSLCGNLTLISGGSGAAIVSNLSTPSGQPNAARQPLPWRPHTSSTLAAGDNFRLTFTRYLRFIAPTSVLFLVLGNVVISLLLLIG